MYEANIAPFPFWGAKTVSKGGRDPLAVQNSSVVIYTNMITGITNVTVRVRYNGFFCWLLTLIAKRFEKIDISKIDNPTEQIKLIRRGELLLAYIMLDSYPEVTGVSGSIYSQNHFNDETINLAWGTDFENKKQHRIYWQNPWGIFGQYYIGALSQLSLIFFPGGEHKTYRVTEEGLGLANIYAESFTKEVEDLFWNSIYSGKVAKSSLSKMNDLALHQIENENELAEYARIFCKPDRQDITGNDINHRINSIKLILDYIRTDGKDVLPRYFVLAFLRHNFEQVLNNMDDASTVQVSWFLYELNELSHAAYEAFHFAVLYSITEEPQPLDVILDILRKEFESYKPTESTENIYALYNNVKRCYKDRGYGALVYEASRMIITLFKALENHIEFLLEFGKNENYDIGHPGFAPSLLIRLVDENSSVTWNFVENCIYFAINDHLRSSYSKSTIGQGLVHNYMVEDGLIWRLRRPEPIRTSPRLQNVLQYIEDMKWIELSGDYYTITERGLKVLNND